MYVRACQTLSLNFSIYTFIRLQIQATLSNFGKVTKAIPASANQGAIKDGCLLLMSARWFEIAVALIWLRPEVEAKVDENLTSNMRPYTAIGVRQCFQKNRPCPPGLAVGTNPAPNNSHFFESGMAKNCSSYHDLTETAKAALPN
jgi:hypothetical protein